MKHCIACGSHIVEPLYSAGYQPLFALNLPKTYEEAKNAPRYPMDFYICCYCGHVWNIKFDYAKVPYEEDSNLMYNNGESWKTHLESLAQWLYKTYNIQDKTIIDIGAGDGDFLNIIKQQYKGMNTRCIAFEPGIESTTCNRKGLEVCADYFIPDNDIQKFKPDILIARHVLEHMQNPQDFVAKIAYYADVNRAYPIFFVEVPCIEKALNTYRITDFLYEHVSNFTQRSLRMMFESVGWKTYDEFLAYDDEVAIWVGQPKSLPFQRAKAFRDHTWDAVINIQSKVKTGSIAFWGGTGKGAAFLNAYNLTGNRVVDSDIRKVGRFVPGTGQEIEHADSLLENPVDMIMITTRWRAKDIYNEIKKKGITYKELLVVEDSQLREYNE